MASTKTSQILVLPGYTPSPQEPWARHWPPLERFVTELFSKQHRTPASVRLSHSLTKLYNHANAMANYDLESRMHEQIMSLMGRFISLEMRRIIKASQETLDNLNAFWLHMKLASAYMVRVFARLDSIYIPAQVRSGNAIKRIWDSITLLVKNNFLKEKSLIDTMFQELFGLISHDRKTHSDGSQIVANTVNMLDVLGLYDRFEELFLDQTRGFFTAQSSEQLDNSSLSEYIFYAGGTLQEEYKRNSEYLLQRTRTSVEMVVRECLVSLHVVELLQNPQLPHLFSEMHVDQIKRLFQLLQHVQLASELNKFWEKHISQRGEEVLAGILKIEGIMSKQREQDQAINGILEVISTSEEMLTRAFGDAKQFRMSHKTACERFINDNPSFVSELLAKYLNNMLKRGEGSSSQHQSEDQLNSLLERVMRIFRFLQGKDMFESFYRRCIVKRLLLKRSVSDDADTDILRKLKLDCGSEYTKKLEVMFNDIQKSDKVLKDFSSAIKEPANTSNNKFHFAYNVQVIQSGAWPIDMDHITPVQNAAIPPSILLFQDQFEKYYSKAHEGTRLVWDYTNNNVELEARFPRMKNPVILRINGRQAMLLLLFNSGETYTIAALTKELGISQRDVQDDLASFLFNKRHRVLKLVGKSAEKAVLSAEDQVDVERAFVSKVRVIDIKIMMRKEVQEKEQQEVMSEVKEHRGILLDSFIVRVMKTRKELEHEKLMGEVMALCKFKFERTHFKQRIEQLIEKEYIRRDEDNLKLYHYIS